MKHTCCANGVKYARTLELLFPLSTFEYIEHIKCLQELFGTLKTIDGLYSCPFGFIQVCFYFFPFMFILCFTLILGTFPIQVKIVGKTELLCLPSRFLLDQQGDLPRPALGGMIKRLQMRVFSPLHSPQVLGRILIHCGSNGFVPKGHLDSNHLQKGR